MAQEYKIKSVKRGTDWNDGMFWVIMTFEYYPNNVSYLTKSEPKEGDVVYGNIEKQTKDGKTSYRFKKEKKDNFGDKSEYYKKQEEKEKKREEERKESEKAKLASFCTSYASRMVIEGIVPFYQKGYSINDLSLDILNLLTEQDVPLPPIERSPFFSYAIDMYVKYKKDKADPSIKEENKFKLTDKIEEINEQDGDVVKPKKVFSLFRGLIVNTKKLHEKLSN